MARRARCTIQRDDERFVPILSTMRLGADMCHVSSTCPSNDSARPSEKDIEEAGMRTATSRRDGYQLLSLDGARREKPRLNSSVKGARRRVSCWASATLNEDGIYSGR